MKGKCAVVTGGNRGIGRAIAVKLAKEGASIIINYRSDEEGALETLRLIEELGGKAQIFKADVSKTQEALNLINYSKEKFNGIDILVNNAGITKDGLILRMKEEDFDKVIEVNLKGTFNCIKHAVPVMLKKKEGVILNISSVAGVMGNVGQCNYSASKAGIIGLTKSLAKELGGKNIRINAIAPGFINTDMTKYLSDEVKENIRKSTALKKFGEPEDIAETAAFLCSKSGGYITGQVISVDGGMAI
ncbi:MAG: 3-oxoacyl-[acyl-carrier-protein] reductase [Clostridium sp.]|uniref:3-oxoacyl-[acyl-carrier-protein] reductase n=1 Tax=Clostridium sp. TaxID=1506 RepID=UPI002A8F3E6A|nr:3-oxoacyl-[acyl-carrier-protein] reductase [Clostridium sp.]MDY5098058.1 3-oxoacyl-[acyl-carrier-protein] reductase [Clostridium sp.]